MSVKFPDDGEILDPIIQGYKEYQRAEWLKYFRHRLYIRRKGKCDLCGRPAQGFDIHEGIFQRRWLPKDKQLCLFTEYNCLILHRRCHIPHPPSREKALEILIGHYGRETLWEWKKGLPFKVSPRMPEK